MAVNIAEVRSVYKVLIGGAKGTLTDQYDSGYVKGHGYAEVLSGAIATAMQMAVMAVVEKPITDAQELDIKVKDFVLLAESEKEREYKDAQIAMADKQIAMENAKQAITAIEDGLKSVQSGADADLKDAQKLMIDKQVLTEGAKAVLIDRQKRGYDDQLKIKEAEFYVQVAGMTAASSGAISEENYLHTSMAAALEAIPVNLL